ncbi:efflux RND transporter periplasmic adaptor subunit [Brachyspira hampsonii]|nr:membrane fusion protein [Brachyspira hampsonii 30599]MBW5379270.1 efflux RND transporter periplasmic adaptor subunit [Brachyspira hampsonii]MBW5410409.1 efflux RND transporter periplasmic adaptor subunit [Brachyspira hampsonii]
MRRVNIIILSIVLILSFLSASCKKSAVDLKKKENPISVLVAAPIKQHLEEYLDLSAEIKAIKEVEISSDVPGKIASILKYEGSFVNKGDTIALIDRFVIGANYAYAPARTPISGYVTTTYMAAGASIAASTPIANVADISQLEVEIQVPERSISGIELGQKVIIRVPSAPNKEIEAEITKRDYAVNPSTRTLMVKALIDNKDRLLLPGMFSDVSILLNSADNVFVIPNSAMFSDDLGKNYIYVVKEDNSNNPPSEVQAANSTNVQYRAYTREVNVLFTSKDKVALSGGLEEGEEVVMFGREFLKNGSLVNRIENDPTILEYITPQATAVASANTNQNTSANQTAAVKKEDTSASKQTTTAKPSSTAAPKQTTTTNPAAAAKQTTSQPKTTSTNTAKTADTDNSSSDNGIYSIGG